MKIGILETGHVPEGLADELRNYSTMFRELLTSEAGDNEFVNFQIWNGPLPESTDVCDVWVITGSQYNAWQDDPWMKRLGTFIQTCHKTRKKMLGICFGHQIIAHSLGGRCGPADEGWGAGQRNFLINKSRPWMAPPARAMGLLYSHADQVIQLPPDAELLGKSDFCPVEMYSIGNHVFCMQGHPEFSIEYARDLWKSSREEIGKDKWKAADKSISPNFNNHLVRRWIHSFLGI